MANTPIKKKGPAQKPARSKIVRYGLIGTGIAFGVFIFLLTAIYIVFSSGLPKISSLKEYKPSTITYVYSDDERKIGEFYKERRVVIPLEEIPKKLIQAVIAVEDTRFYSHQGIDIYGVVRAFLRNLTAGAIVQGGSTITQQVAKSFFLTPERKYSRKIKEAILAFRINKSFSKDEILFLYLNQIYLGHGAYGVEAASENYFGKNAKDLTLAESALLAGLPKAPTKYSPFNNPEEAKKRQIFVLNRMVDEGFISESEAKTAINEVISIKQRRNYFNEKVPCYTEYVRQYIVKKYGDSAIYNQGLIIHTAVNIEMQKAAQEEIIKGLVELDKRQGYRGPAKHLSGDEIDSFLQNARKILEDDPIEKGKSYKAVITKINTDRNEASVKIGNELGVFSMSSINWARKTESADGTTANVDQSLSPGDVVLVSVKGLRKKGKDPNDEELDRDSRKTDSKLRVWELALQQTPYSEAALLCIEAETGLVKAMIGGRDFNDSQFNRAIQSKRQPGSAIKPIIYSAALDKGYTPASVIVDSPLVFKDASGQEVWKPHNYDGSFNGPTLLRHAIAMSMNIVTIKILQDIGIEYVMDYARNLGITSPLQKDLTIALGSSEVSLIELVRAYSVFNNMGELIEPVFITKIEDKYGHVIEENAPVKKQVIEKNTAYIMTSLLTSVVQGGTASRARGLGRPAAGKTGTTNDLNDAWFVGYTPQLTTGVWVGNDTKIPLGHGETGAKTAIPIWLGFMQKALKNKPVEPFKVPEGVIYVDINARNGRAASPGSGNVIHECFKEGTGPKPALAGGSEQEEEQPKDETTVMFKEGL